MRTLLVGMVLVLANAGSHAQQYEFYAGNLHAHTLYSDGHTDGGVRSAKTPELAYKFAKESEHMDFLGISEHNHKAAKMKLANYAKGISEADKINSSKLVCLYGMEYGVISHGGHTLIYGIDKLIGWDKDNYDIKCPKSDYNALWDIVVDYPEAFVTLAHPKNGDFSNLLNSPYSKSADKAISGCAILTGPAFAKNINYKSKPSGTFVGYFQGLLALGYHLGPTVDHDNHYMTYGRMASSRTMILAEKLDRESVMKAFRDMRFYATTDWNVQVSFVINKLPMGSLINTKNPAAITVDVSDTDPGDDTSTIKVMYGVPGSKKPATMLTSVKGNKLSFVHDLPKGNEFYYYLDITQADRDRIYTSPIWVHRLK